MNHPDELLAPYVDGSLPEAERADVVRHIQGCARCRRQAGLAAGARSALRTIPDAAPPEELAAAAIEAAERRAEPLTPAGRSPGRPEGQPRWVVWTTAAAGVAAALIVASIVLPNIGGGPSGGRTRAAAADARALAPASAVEVQQADYDPAAVRGLALAYTTPGPPSVPGAEQGEAGVATGVFGSNDAPANRLDPGGVSAATACLSKAFGQPNGTLVRVIQARYQGTPAYIGVYLVGPGAGQPPDRAWVYVAAQDGCTIITALQALL